MLDAKKVVTVLVCCSLLSACAALDERRVSNPLAVDGTSRTRWFGTEREALAWLASYRVLANAPLEEQRRQHLAAQAAANKENTDSNRLRLALTLSLPGVPWRDDNKLITTLEAPPSLFKLPDSSLHQLVFVLYKQAQERQRLRDDQRKRENELLEEQKRLRDEQKRHEAELLDEQRRNEELQMKLDALRRIDQDIKHRKHGLESTP